MSQYHEKIHDLCTSILNLNSKITLCAILNEKGRVEEIKTRGSILEYFSSPKKEAFFMEYSLLQNMNKEYDENLGKVEYTCDQREKRVLFSFPIMNFLLIVGCKNEINFTSLANKIKSLIRETIVRVEKDKDIIKGLQF